MHYRIVITAALARQSRETNFLRALVLYTLVVPDVPLTGPYTVFSIDSEVGVIR